MFIRAPHDSTSANQTSPSTNIETIYIIILYFPLYCGRGDVPDVMASSRSPKSLLIMTAEFIVQLCCTQTITSSKGQLVSRL